MKKTFSWLQFCSRFGIDFVDSGKNVSRGEINIECPFCAGDDPSKHMCLSLTAREPYWHCWRSSNHKGRSPYRLIRKLIRCSHTEALELIGIDVTDLTEFDQVLKDPDKFFNQSSKKKRRSQVLEVPAEFRNFDGKKKVEGVYAQYLVETRNFDLTKVTRAYRLKYSISGFFHSRIIFPVYFQRKLVSWTGRSIYSNAELRYLSLSDSDDTYDRLGYSALISIKDTLFHFDRLIKTSGEVLFITEGVFDFAKIDLYGREFECRATCLFSLTITDAQKYLLQALSTNFRHLVILLDEKEYLAAQELYSELSFIRNIEVCTILQKFKVEDPGDLTKTQVGELCKLYTS